jgi:hypothetical protein
MIDSPVMAPAPALHLVRRIKAAPTSSREQSGTWRKQ